MQPAAVPVPKTAALAAVKPRVLQFDAELGVPITAQEEVIIQTAKAEPVSLPWRQSFTDVPNTHREREAAMRAALQALYSIHLASEFYDAMPIDIVWDSEQNQRKVVTTSTVPPFALVLPPCVPKATRLVTASPHPHKVAVTVRFKTKATRSREGVTQASPQGTGAPKGSPQKASPPKASAKASGAKGQGKQPAVVVPPEQQEEEEKPAAEHVFFAVPEWKAPRPAKTKERASDAEIQKEGSSSGPPADGPPAGWIWDGDETMHPFWAVTRMGDEKRMSLDKKNPDDISSPFNMTYLDLSFNTLTVGKVADRAVTMTAEVIVPCLTNNIEIPKGAQLLLQVEPPRREPKPSKRNWRDSVAEELKAEKKAARTGESPCAAVDI